MSRFPHQDHAAGPFRVHQLPEDSGYELSHGHPLRCAPAGARHGQAKAWGAMVLGSDPDVDGAAVDTGFALAEDTLRAPDIAVGNVPNTPGWVRGAPALAVEYLDAGQDEEQLYQRVADLLAAGTRFIWVVRLTGPRRVEVHERNKPMQLVLPGQDLLAPGVLRNPVPVNALFDNAAAQDVTLRNLLQRHGYADLDAVRDDGRAEGRSRSILELLEARGLSPSAEHRTRVLACRDPEVLKQWLVRAATATRVEDVLG